MNGRAKTTRRAFTLVEVLTVAAVITLLVVMLLPALNKYRQIVKSGMSQAQINKLDLGCRQYFNEFNSVYPPSSGYGLSGGQLLVMFMTGIGYSPASPLPGTPPGFRELGGTVVHGPYNGAENIPTEGGTPPPTHPYFLDVFNNPILYYCSVNPDTGGYNADNPGGPGDVNGYARGNVSGDPYLRKDFLLMTKGADGQWCPSGKPVSASDDITNLYSNK